MKDRFLWSLALAVVVAAVTTWMFSVNFKSAEMDLEASGGKTVAAERRRGDAEKTESEEPKSSTAEVEEDDEASEESDDPRPEMTAEEKAEAEVEAKVDAFDTLTDKWMEPSKAGVSMKDIETFSRTFRAVPKERQDECAHRALNLIPDENVMLLAGILMDKTMDKEIVETVFNDVLNRDETVKMPIMREILKDKSHPCWADVAWILDVTGAQEGSDK